MIHGLPDDAVAKIRGVFSRNPGIRKAVLYGSRAKGNPKPGSDIDLTLIAPGLGHADLLHIADDLDELSLPWTVDLSLHESLDSESLREHIQRVGKAFYEREAEPVPSESRKTEF